MESKHTIRVVMLCHFSNPEIRKELPLSSRKCEIFMLKLLFSKKTGYLDFAQWNTDIIDGLSKSNDIELFVISPHEGLRRKVFRFQNNGVHYVFFRGVPSFPFNYVDRILKVDQNNNYQSNRKIIKYEIDSIRPDLVLLVGAENPYYSISALDIEHIPIFLQCQTVYANPDRKELAGSIDQYRWDTELKIFEKTMYYACAGKMYYDLIKKYNPNALVFPRMWPCSTFPKVEQMQKKYDFVFFAHYLSIKKGFDNAIEAISIVSKSKPDIKLLAIGSFDKDKQTFLDRIKKLGIEKNIIFQSPIQEYEVLLKCVTQARFALLPIKIDVLSGTLLEAMYLGLPIVTCKTSGTPSLNEKCKTVLISDIGDNETLAKHMIELMDSPELVQELKVNMQYYLDERSRKSNNNLSVFVEQIHSVMNHHYKDMPIPQEQLFDSVK